MFIISLNVINICQLQQTNRNSNSTSILSAEFAFISQVVLAGLDDGAQRLKTLERYQNFLDQLGGLGLFHIYTFCKSMSRNILKLLTYAMKLKSGHRVAC